MINVFIGSNAVIAKESIGFEEAGINAVNTASITAFNPLKSYKPDRQINSLNTGFINDTQYLIVMKQDADFTAFLNPPIITAYGIFLNSNYVSEPDNLPADFELTNISIANQSDSILIKDTGSGKMLLANWPNSVNPHFKIVSIIKHFNQSGNEGLTIGQNAISDTIPYKASLYSIFNTQLGKIQTYLNNATPVLLNQNSNGALIVNNNDIVKCTVEWNASNSTFKSTMLNLSTSQEINLTINSFVSPNYAPTIYRLYIKPAVTANGGSKLISVKALTNSYENADYVAVGDSITQGHTNVSFAGMWLQQLKAFKTEHKFQLDGMGSMRTKDMYLWKDETIKLNPKKILLMSGANDQGFSLATQQADYSQLVNFYKANGKTVIHLLTTPQNANNVTPLNTWKQSTFTSDIIIDTYTPLKAPSGTGLNPIYDTGDGLHPNTNGHTLLKNTIASYII